MLHWNDLHPYNAINVVRIPAALDGERLGRVINNTLSAHGLTGLTLDRARGRFHYAGGPVACEIKAVDLMENRADALRGEIERQLNTAFIPAEHFNPFRFFTVPEPDGFSLGIVYFHPIADAEAVLLLIRDLVAAYLKTDGPPPVEPLDLYPACRDGLLAQPGRLPGILAALPALMRNMRRSGRLKYRSQEEDLSNRFTFLVLTPGQLAALLRTAKAWEMTLNDLFLALLLKCLTAIESDRGTHPRRRNISIGCIVNLRKDFGLEGRRVFGPLLSSFIVTQETPDAASLKEMAQSIRRQTLVIKKGRLYLGTSWELAFGRFMFSWYRPDQQKKLYPKHYPLWGGLTNVNLNSLWPPPAGEKPFDCFGAVSTGPLVPLVFSVMTVQDRVNLAITYRPVFFSEPDIERMKRDLVELVAGLEAVRDKPAADKAAGG